MFAQESKINFLLLVFTLIFGSVSCSEPTVPGGEITIKNDILDKEYNSFTVDSVISKSGSTGFRATLKPGQSLVIPHKSVRSMRIIRRYEDHSKIYQVKCPASFNLQTTMKLIDIHSNRLSGGCKLVKRGVQERGGYTKWE